MDSEPKYITEAIKTLKALTSEKYGDLKLPPNSDGNEILERCLRRKKWNVKEAADLVHSYFELLSTLQGIAMENYFLPSVQKSYFFDSFAFSVLKHRDVKGRPIIWINMDKIPVEPDCDDRSVVAAFVLLNELMRQSVDNQKSGVTYIINYNSSQFSKMKNLPFSRKRDIANNIQDSLPVSFQNIHMINCPPSFYCGYAMLKPFLGKKIRDRIHIHGNNLSKFHKCVDPSGLPYILGGEKSVEQCVDTEFMKKLCTQDGYYTELLKYGYADPVLIESSQVTAKLNVKNNNKHG